VKSRRTTRILLVLGVAGLVAAPVGWFGSDALEQDNDFCNACHLEPGVPLHIDIRENFDARPVSSLAAIHARASHPRRPESEPFRCIDCHGGASFLGKARTKVLAAKDGFWWAVGHFEEPTEMAWPLLDEDCQQCHEDFSEAEARADEPNPPFHALGVHNVALGMTCVECHRSHDPGGSEELYYLHPAHVRSQCAECHGEFE
jgi:nitrate/TMAO reductase-like tetraheme cytochrome c subunit